MPIDNSTSTDGVQLNALGSSGGALVATDLLQINGNAASHVQYVKLGWGGTGDTFYPVGDETHNSTSRPLPVMLRHTDGTALTQTSSALDVHVKTQGATFDVNLFHTLGSIFITGTAGMSPLEVMGSSSGHAAVYVQATAGSTLPNSGINTIPSLLFGLSGNTAEPLGSTNGRLKVDLTGQFVGVSAGAGTPLYILSTGGISAAGMAMGMKPHEAFPTLILGNCGGTAAAVGVTNDGAGTALRVYQEATSTVAFDLTGTAGIGDGRKTMPTLLYGMCAGGPSAAAVGVTGPAASRRLLTSLDGSRVAVDNFDGQGLWVRATGGITQANPGINTLPVMLFGLCGGTAMPVGVTNGRLDVHMGSACLTVDVTISPNLPVINATADTGVHNRYLRVAGMSSAEVAANELTPVFVTGRNDGSTHAYPLGITTHGIAGTTAGGGWHLMVTGDVHVNRWSAGTLTVSATNLDVRGLTAKGGKDIVGVQGTSGEHPLLIAATGGFTTPTTSATKAVNMLPTNIFGVCAGGDAEPIGSTLGHLQVHGENLKLQAQGSAYPVYVVATGGISAAGMAMGAKPHEVHPTLVLGNSGGTAAAIGATHDGYDKALRVFHGATLTVAAPATQPLYILATGGTGSGALGVHASIPINNTFPSLMLGMSAGGSAAPIGMSGDALNVNLINAGITVDVMVGTHVEISNDGGPALYIQGTTQGTSGGSPIGAIPVYVAGGTYGEAVYVTGTAGGLPMMVEGFSAGGNYGTRPIGITSGSNWNMSSDTELQNIGATLGKTFKMFVEALGGDSNNDGIAENRFSTKAQMDAMAPNGQASSDRIADAKDMREARDYLETVASTVTSGPGQEITNQLQVDIIDILQPSAFTSGQQELTSSPIQMQTGVGFTLESGIKIKGHQDNSNFIYVGDNNVSTTKGFPLGPSEEIFIEIDNLKQLYAVSSTATGLTLCYIGS